MDKDFAKDRLMSDEFVEKRSSVRYEVNSTVDVVAYISEEKSYALLSPIEAILVNISKGGVRLKMRPNSMSMEDTVQISLKIGDKQRLLNAQVVNIKDGDGSTEYGCKLI